MKSRITNADLYDAKRHGQKIVAVSCYDYTTARLVAQTNTQVILVGDSAARADSARHGLSGHDTSPAGTVVLQHPVHRVKNSTRQ